MFYCIISDYVVKIKYPKDIFYDVLILPLFFKCVITNGWSTFSRLKPLCLVPAGPFFNYLGQGVIY